MTEHPKAELTEQEYEDLAARLTDPDYVLTSGGQVKTGADAAAEGRAFMVREYGSAAELDKVLRQAGRPRIGQAPKGASPTVRARISDADYAAVKRLEEVTGRTQSDLVREAVHQFLHSQNGQLRRSGRRGPLLTSLTTSWRVVDRVFV